MATTTNLALPYPALSAAPNVPQDLQLLAAQLDTIIGGAWSSYTPVWTSTGTAPTLGNGTLVGAYRQLGKTIDLRVTLTIGSTTSIGTGVYRLSLPAAAKAECLLAAMFVDLSASSALYPMTARVFANLATGDNMRVALPANGGAWGSTLPATHANGDIITLAGTYEAA